MESTSAFSITEKDEKEEDRYYRGASFLETYLGMHLERFTVWVNVYKTVQRHQITNLATDRTTVWNTRHFYYQPPVKYLTFLSKKSLGLVVDVKAALRQCTLLRRIKK